jgi:hypothetical protein
VQLPVSALRIWYCSPIDVLNKEEPPGIVGKVVRISGVLSKSMLFDNEESQIGDTGNREACSVENLVTKTSNYFYVEVVGMGGQNGDMFTTKIGNIAPPLYGRFTTREEVRSATRGANGLGGENELCEC